MIIAVLKSCRVDIAPSTAQSIGGHWVKGVSSLFLPRLTAGRGDCLSVSLIQLRDDLRWLFIDFLGSRRQHSKSDHAWDHDQGPSKT
jgi:hypothetical protein